MAENTGGSIEGYTVPTAPFRPGDEADFGGSWKEHKTYKAKLESAKK